jgi:chemotaxis protein CheX
MANESVDVKELIFQVFIDTINNYFDEVTKERSETGLPFLKRYDQMVIEEYTGIIGISGNKKGFVYVTGNRDIFAELVKIILKQNKEIDEAQIIDMCGEVANTISGNVRKAFGADFMISVPAIVVGKPENLKLPNDTPMFVIPVKWKGYKAYLVLGLE